MLKRGYYDRFGGAYLPEILVSTFEELIVVFLVFLTLLSFPSSLRLFDLLHLPLVGIILRLPVLLDLVYRILLVLHQEK